MGVRVLHSLRGFINAHVQVACLSVMVDQQVNTCVIHAAGCCSVSCWCVVLCCVIQRDKRVLPKLDCYMAEVCGSSDVFVRAKEYFRLHSGNMKHLHTSGSRTLAVTSLVQHRNTWTHIVCKASGIPAICKL